MKNLLYLFLLLSLSANSQNFINSIEPRGRGYCGTAEIGTYIIVTQGSSAAQFSLRTFQGGRLSQIVSLGFETGVDLGFTRGLLELVTVPADVAIRINILKKRITPFIDFKAGYSAYFTPNAFANGMNISPCIGFKLWATQGLAVTLKTGYAANLIIGNGVSYYTTVPVMFGLEF